MELLIDLLSFSSFYAPVSCSDNKISQIGKKNVVLGFTNKVR